MSIRRSSFNIDRRLEQIKNRLDRLPADAHREFVATTPIDTGNARRSTDLRGSSIVADYDYANRLNTGYSRQAPGGMTDPTIEYIRAEIRRM